ncbi:MAG: hypothetical protein ACI9XB_000822, partial [Gammaproteobacteria bacterium]
LAVDHSNATSFCCFLPVKEINSTGKPPLMMRP